LLLIYLYISVTYLFIYLFSIVYISFVSNFVGFHNVGNNIETYIFNIIHQYHLTDENVM